MRNWLLVLHILGAAGWIGGGLYGWFSYVVLARSGPEIRNGALVTLSGRANRFFGATVALTLLTGITLVITQAAWGWTDLFVWFGVGMFVFSGIWQSLVSSKAEDRLLAASAGDGDDLLGAIGSFHLSAAVEMAVLLLVLWSMVVKLGA